MGSGALGAINPMIAGLAESGAQIPLKTAVSVLVASIIYLALMMLVFKVATMLTKSWRMSRAQNNAVGNSFMSFGGGYQERSLIPAPAQAAASSTPSSLASDRVRSTVASLEVMTSSQRLMPSSAPLAMPASAPVPALAGPNDARGQLRYLHHRVAGAPNHASREIVR
jgi:hypothetical protein